MSTSLRGRPMIGVFFERDGETWRPCTSCGSDKPLREFPPLKNGPRGHHSWCLECRREYTREYRRGKRQPSGTDLVTAIDAEPLTDREVYFRNERRRREARGEGPKYCDCGAKLRLGNRRRGTCDPCHEREARRKFEVLWGSEAR